MSDETVMKSAIVSMLPKGAAWEIAPDGDLDHLLDGISDGMETTREDVGRVGNTRNPLTTPYLDDLEIELGVVPEPDISEIVRRGYLNSVKNEKPKTGSDDHLEALLIAAGFDVLVVRNDPPVDPASILFGDPIATCGDPTKTCGDADTRCGMTSDGELLVNGDSVTEQEPLYTVTCGSPTSTCGDAETTCGAFLSMRREYYAYPIPENPARWPFFFWVCGGIDGLDDLIDWNMEMYGADNWPAGGGANVKKVMSPVHSGIRSLEVRSGGGDLELQQGQPANPDADLQSFYRMSDVGGAVVENLAWKNELVDGNMEKPGSDVIVDGDMEVTGPDVITDGDMEAVGVAAWNAVNAVLTKQGSPHSGTQCLRMAQTIAATSAQAQQSFLTVGKTYRIKGWARSDGVLVPQVRDSTGALAWLGTTSTSWQPFDFVDVCGHANLQLRSENGAGIIGDYVEFDDITVTDETVACAAWIVGNTPLLSKQEDAYEGAQCLRIEYDGTPGPLAYQNIITIGKTYRIKGQARGDGTAYPRITGAAAGLWNGTTSTAWQAFDFLYLGVVGTGLYLKSSGASASHVEFDDVFVIDLDAGASDYTNAGNTTAAKSEVTPQDGQRCLRVTNGGTNGAGDYVKPAVDVLVIGNDFRITGYGRGNGTATAQLKDGAAGPYLWQSTISSTWQAFDFTFTAAAVDLRFYVDLINDYAEFDQIVVNAIPGAVPTLGADASNANGVNVPTPWVKGIEFNGVDAKVDAGAVNLAMSMENMTMIGWFYLNDITTPADQGLITNGSVGVSRQGLYTSGGFIRYSCVSGTAKIIETAITLQYQENWRVRIGVTRTYDGAETVEKLFVNGVLKDTLEFRGAPDVTITQAWIGWLTGASFFNGTAADSISLFNSGKSDAYMLTDYEDGIGAMLAGPYAEQLPTAEITTERPLEGYAWGDPDTVAIPMIYVLNTTTDDWTPVWIGLASPSKQTISETLDNFGGIRLYAKGALGLSRYDDISINDPVFTQAEIPSKLRDKFRKLVLKAKRLGTYAGLLVNWTGETP